MASARRCSLPWSFSAHVSTSAKGEIEIGQRLGNGEHVVELAVEVSASTASIDDACWVKPLRNDNRKPAEDANHNYKNWIV